MSSNLKFMEMNYREVPCNKEVSGGAFSQGIQDFSFTVGYPVSWIPSCTYFRMTCTIQNGGSLQPVFGDNIAFAENAANNLYGNVYFKAGQQDMSNIVSYSAQASMFKHRAFKPGALLNNVGASAYMLNAPFRQRQKLVDVLNGAEPDSGNVEYENIPGNHKNKVDIIFQPGGLGIWDYSNPMPSGEYRFTLNPTQNLLAAAQGNPFNPLNINNAIITVQDVKLYICTVRVTPELENMDFRANLPEYAICQKPATGLTSTLDFQVPPSTYMLGFFIQDGAAGVPTGTAPNEISLSTFTGLNNEETQLVSYQISYANQTKPSTAWTTAYGGNENRLQSRYFNNIVENDLYKNPGGSESLAEYIERGPYILHSFIRDKDDKSTQVQLTVQLAGPVAPTTQIFLVAIYAKETEIQSKNGRITVVRTLNV